VQVYLSSSDVEACMTVVLPVACAGGMTPVAVPLTPLTADSRLTTVDVLPRAGGAAVGCWSVLDAGGSLAVAAAGGGGGGGGARSPIRQLNRW